MIGVGGKVAMMQATNVTIRLAEDFSIHWPVILVLPKGLSNPPGTNDDFFGILDAIERLLCGTRLWI